jgi:hypothetical protein
LYCPHQGLTTFSPLSALLCAGCTRGIGGKVSCQSDVPYTQAILKLRAVLPRPYLIATAAWSIGAYGEG